MNDENKQYEVKKQFDFDTFEQECLCDLNIKDLETPIDMNISQKSSSSDDEEDYFESFLPEFDKYSNEFENLFSAIDPIANALTRFKGVFRGIENINFINFISDVENFFVHKTDTKVTQLKACPNSMIPILPRNPNDEDCPPTYFTDIECRKFLKGFNPGSKSYVIRAIGLKFVYDSQRKFDIQSNFVISSRTFYTKIFNERLSKTKVKDDKLYNEINLPLALYEANTFIKRFCDFFTYFPFIFDDIYQMSLDKPLVDQFVLCKISSAILAGIHKVISSQGIPLTALVGETYETFNRMFYLFAEVRNDKNPTMIQYNIRFRDRFIVLNGWAEIWWKYKEKEDIIILKMSSYNKMEIQSNTRTKQVYEFSFPREFVIKGIIEEIESEQIRLIIVNSFFYVKGQSKSAFILFNSYDDNVIKHNLDTFLENIVSNLEVLESKHYCIGLIYDTS